MNLLIEIDVRLLPVKESNELVTKWMKEAQTHHEAFIAAVKETRVLVAEANKKHDEFVACKTKADEMHNKAMELREKVMAVKGERAAQYRAEKNEIRGINDRARQAVNDPAARKRAEDSALELLKKGGKISL